MSALSDIFKVEECVFTSSPESPVYRSVISLRYDTPDDIPFLYRHLRSVAGFYLSKDFIVVVDDKSVNLYFDPIPF